MLAKMGVLELINAQRYYLSGSEDMLASAVFGVMLYSSMNRELETKLMKVQQDLFKYA